MLYLNKITKEEFLTDFWQKKPLVIRQALPNFVNLITPDELAGLAMEEDLESRLVRSTPNAHPFWHLQEGPFLEKDFTLLPESHWTLLVNGVDKFIPDLSQLFDHFNFIPQWRIDDLMISYAVENGSVGPHYDQYDVFLYQARGSRKWSLTTKNCEESNYMPNVPLRIMQQFDIEQEYILNEGDMLYLPPKIGHYGTAIDGDCMTYSFGYRSYVNQELWDDFGDYYSETKNTSLYKDPNWTTLTGTSAIPDAAWLNAKQLMQEMLNDDVKIRSWFGCFVTRLDAQANNTLPEPIDESLSVFIEELSHSQGLTRHSCCRFAYFEGSKQASGQMFINGEEWDIQGVSMDLIKLVANNNLLPLEKLDPWLNIEANQCFLFRLWTLQWLDNTI